MTIGQLAGQAGVNVQTVRYYERRALLDEPPRTRGGYRMYCREDLLRLRFIQRAKQLGFTLTEVRELLDLRVDPRRKAEDVRRRAQEKIVDVAARIRDLERVRAALRQIVAGCSAHGAPADCALIHAIETEPLPDGGNDENRDEDAVDCDAAGRRTGRRSAAGRRAL